MTASDIHKIIQQISLEYSGGTPPIKLQNLAEQLGLSTELISEYVDALSTLGLIEYQDDDKMVINLTMSGKLAQLP